MTPLAQRLIAQITATGPITVADYMAQALMDPTHGYYATRDPFGTSGDFTTAPEISQMFGELIGLCLAQSWLDQGAPERFTLAELGPGRATLMADALRATAQVPGFGAAAEVHLVEASPTLREIQAKTLRTHAPQWHDTVDTLPDQPLFLIANEFFDALPIRQFQRSEQGWHERQIGVQDGSLTFGLSAPIHTLDHRLTDTKPGDIVETCAPAAAIAQQISARVAEAGAAVFVDYGGWHSLGDTLQALRNHAPESPLAHPGEADLTAHVDFEPLATGPAKATGLTAQGVFLERLGITPRAQQLARNLTSDALQSHIAAHRRLTHPAEMGTLFKALALYPPHAAPPPGFDS